MIPLQTQHFFAVEISKESAIAQFSSLRCGGNLVFWSSFSPMYSSSAKGGASYCPGIVFSNGFGDITNMLDFVDLAVSGLY